MQERLKKYGVYRDSSLVGHVYGVSKWHAKQVASAKYGYDITIK